MNSCEERQEAKRDRLRAAVAKRRLESERLYKTGNDSLSQIPFGQPILVGHHSENADRSYRSRAVGKIERSFNLSDEASDLEGCADRVGTGGISSDDPEAVQKLDTQLDQLLELQARMVAGNKEAREQGQPRCYMPYQLTNNSANIRRIKHRIEQLEKPRDWRNCLCRNLGCVQDAGMHIPWPKCPICKAPMSLKRRTSRLDDIVEADESSFVCERCPRKKRPGPYFPDK